MSLSANASLVVVGTGIKFLSHLTTEAKAYIEQSDKVFYLVNEPAMQEWINKCNPHAESLDKIYLQYAQRLQCYRAITNYILENLRENKHVCVVLYGHPTVYAQSGLDAVIKAKQEGYYTAILPGISAEDCLFADLLIDPGSCGCQSYEATDFLIHRRQYDISSHLVLWQVGMIGALGHANAHDNSIGIKLLTDYLVQKYSPSHQVTLYEAAQYPHFAPYIQTVSLAELPNIHFPRIATLYVPPAHKAECDAATMQALNIRRGDLE